MHDNWKKVLPLINFFEKLGVLTHRGKLDKRVVYSLFAYRFFHVVENREFLKALADNDVADCVKDLFDLYYDLRVYEETRYGKNEGRPPIKGFINRYQGHRYRSHPKYRFAVLMKGLWCGPKRWLTRASWLRG